MTPLSKLNGYRGQLTECPTWHPDEDALYWTDLDARQLLRYRPGSEGVDVVCRDVVVGGFTVQPDGALLLFMDGGSVGLYRDGTVEREVLSLPAVTERFNDVIADPDGRVFCGTMPDESGTGGLYKLDVDGSAERLLSRVNVPNGMDFSPDYETLYFTETDSRIVHAFDYDRAAGSITGRSTFAEFHDSEGKPDGLAVDDAGRVWSARWGGGVVDRFSPAGDREWRLSVPARDVTSVCFGGADGRQLFVTTAQREDELGDGGGGAIFVGESDVAGGARHRSRVDLG